MNPDPYDPIAILLHGRAMVVDHYSRRIDNLTRQINLLRAERARTQLPVRNAEIQRRYATGESVTLIAREFGVTPSRVYQICIHKGKLR